MRRAGSIARHQSASTGVEFTMTLDPVKLANATVAERITGEVGGHLHGSRHADLPFPVPVRDRLVAEGRARPHHVLPDSGWVSVPIPVEADVRLVIDLFRMNYDRIPHR